MSAQFSIAELPKCMAERALRARAIAARAPDKIQFDDEMMPWVFDPDEEGVWLNLMGNYSHSSPAEKAEKKRAAEAAYQARVREYAEDVAYQSEIRRRVLERDNHTCQICSSVAVSRLHVHHILKRRDGGTDHYDNLITVCPKCHGKADNSLYAPPWAQRPAEAA